MKIFGKIKIFTSYKRRVVVNRRKGRKHDFLKHKETALKIAHEKILKFNQVYNLKYNRVCIRNQKTRWGSCSKKGNLNFNYKIALIPERHAEYIIVHELCHLKEFNHARSFWEMVSEAIPEYKILRKELVEMSTNLR